MHIDSGKISVQIMGPFSARLGHRSVTPTAGKQRQILALLALRAGQVVSTATLTDELWAGHSPPSSAVTLQTYVFRLRRMLSDASPHGPDARHFLSTRHSGYLLECQTDVEEFRRLARAGREAAEAGNARTASELLSHALALWSGPALADVRQGPALEVEATALAETRLGTLERRIESDLVLNRHNDVTGELVSLVAENPLNENFCALLMRAFYHSGHTAQALEAFRRLRAALNLELGVEPNPRLQRMHQFILSGELPAEAGALAVRTAHAERGSDKKLRHTAEINDYRHRRSCIALQ